MERKILFKSSGPFGRCLLLAARHRLDRICKHSGVLTIPVPGPASSPAQRHNYNIYRDAPRSSPGLGHRAGEEDDNYITLLTFPIIDGLVMDLQLPHERKGVLSQRIARLAIDGEKWKRKNTERNVKCVSVSAICFCPTSWNIRCWMIYPSWLIVLKYAAAIIHLTRARLLRGLPGHKTVNFFSPPVKSEMSRWKVEQPHCGLQFWSVIVVKKLTKNCRFSLSLSLLYI